MSTGYCTVDDVRRVFQQADLTGALADENHRVVADAIESYSDQIERATRRHWFDPDGIAEDDQDVVATDPQTRDDEHDIPTHGGFVHGASEQRRRSRRNSDALLESSPRGRRHRRARRDRKQEIRIATGDVDALKPPIGDSVLAYTRITLERKDVTDVTELLVIDGAAAYEDWTEEKDGGVGNQYRGQDWWVRINNKGVAELYLDVHAMADDIASFANAVYVEIEYGRDELPKHIRRGVAQLVAAELVLEDELVVSIPDDGQLIGVETKAERWERHGREKLKPHVERPDVLGWDPDE